MNIQKQQEVSFKVLQALRNLDSEAIIAGGAPRNWLEGKLANDIDCYLRWHGGSCTRMLKTISKILGTELEMNIEVECTYHFGGDTFTIKHIFSFNYEGVLFQIMIIDQLEPVDFITGILKHMDIGLNKVGWHPWDVRDLNGVNAFVETKEYRADFFNNTLTLYQNLMNPAQLKHCMERHLPKMLSYYPNHTLKIAGV